MFLENHFWQMNMKNKQYPRIRSKWNKCILKRARSLLSYTKQMNSKSLTSTRIKQFRIWLNHFPIWRNMFDEICFKLKFIIIKLVKIKLQKCQKSQFSFRSLLKRNKKQIHKIQTNNKKKKIKINQQYLNHKMMHLQVKSFSNKKKTKKKKNWMKNRHRRRKSQIYFLLTKKIQTTQMMTSSHCLKNITQKKKYYK